MKKNEYIKDINCKYCGQPMVLDDIDYNFPGNQNNYFLCENCNIGCLEKIRYGKSVLIDYTRME